MTDTDWSHFLLHTNSKATQFSHRQPIPTQKLLSLNHLLLINYRFLNIFIFLLIKNRVELIKTLCTKVYMIIKSYIIHWMIWQSQFKTSEIICHTRSITIMSCVPVVKSRSAKYSVIVGEYTFLKFIKFDYYINSHSNYMLP